MTMNVHYQLSSFEELNNEELYTVMRLRQQVFVVEQNCPYLDCDGKDQTSMHLLGWQAKGAERGELVSYLRIIPPTHVDNMIHIGRVVCHPYFRGNGLGQELMLKGINLCGQRFPGSRLHISAQQYLTDFYTELGFSVSTEPYDEDGIPHIGMTYRDGSFIGEGEQGGKKGQT